MQLFMIALRSPSLKQRTLQIVPSLYSLTLTNDCLGQYDNQLQDIGSKPYDVSFLFCSPQICKHNTFLWYHGQSSACGEQHFPVAGTLWSCRSHSSMSCSFDTKSYGPSNKPDIVHVPGGPFHFGQHICAQR